MIVVLGLYRGGSSTVAGVLAHLGVCMGHELKVVPEAAETHGYDTFEDWHLRRACLRCYTEPGLDPLKSFEGRVAVLRDYLQRRINDRAKLPNNGRVTRTVAYEDCDCRLIGAKFPMLCAMGREVEAAWSDQVDRLTFVCVDRPVDVVAKSLRRWYGDHARDFTEKLHRDRTRFLAHRKHVRVSYDALCDHPQLRVRRLAAELVLCGALSNSPTEQQIQKAAAFVSRPGRARSRPPLAPALSSSGGCDD